ncbi:Alpha/Beta hydrolase protein [Truncatella angustata]|uniref:Kynurenine formamidase n=1 Tax=Truncatella angustata TaxID=152316 RepID=A0A9P8UFC1_9PEZI|nr:Alpha/Beta hydrolase protein [Truncatella angustata]KAH6648859.1 Alpha/Beta hydrolase protein [Truncatella angustata]
MASNLSYEVHHYAKDHELQRVGVWKTPDATQGTTSPWVIYIHGGAWRDFRIDHTTFKPTIDAILSSSSGTKSSSSSPPPSSSPPIAGFASIDYRLSPHPSFPQDPATTPAAAYRNASHPDHLDDVWSALALLQRTYGFGGDYVLVGHSAGATLALQLLMGSAAGAAPPPSSGVELPRAVVGLEGIYDLQGLVDRLGPAYAELFIGAFGDASHWAAVSPVRFAKSFRSGWEGGELVVLGWGPDDELIDGPEIEGMARRLDEDKVRTVVFKDLKGTHDGMWQDGRPFAEVILRTLGALSS